MYHTKTVRIARSSCHRPISVSFLLILTFVSTSKSANLAAQLYEKAAPSVFVISVHDGNGRPVAFGSGFLIAKDMLVTNAHVVEGGNCFVDAGAVRIPATVEKRDTLNDLAIIKVAVEIAATPLKLSEKKVLPGENIYVIGNPEGLDKSISSGVVAAARVLDGRKLVQITAPISHGSSGGPVLNSAGEVIGVTVGMMKDGQNLNFAVPAEKLEELLSGKALAAADLTELFSRIDGLTTAFNRMQYSQDPNSEYQETWVELDSLLKFALEAAGNNPKLLLEIAERADDTDAEVKLDAAQRASHIKPSPESNRLLGEALNFKAIFAGQSQKDALQQQAEKAFRSALLLTRTPGAQLYYDLADVLENRGLAPEAKSDFHLALVLSKPGSDLAADSIRGLIRTSDALNKSAESASWFSMLLDTGKATAWDWHAHGSDLVQQGKYDKAGEAFRNSAALGGEWKNHCEAALDFWLTNVKQEDALSSARECIAAGTGKQDSERQLATAHGIIADILNKRGVYSEALSNGREAADLDSTNAWYFEDEADALFGLRRFQEAINASNQAIRLSDGKFAEMHFRLGSSYFELENWEFAEQSFQKAAELNLTDTAAPFNVALCYKRLGTVWMRSNGSKKHYGAILRLKMLPTFNSSFPYFRPVSRDGKYQPLGA